MRRNRVYIDFRNAKQVKWWNTVGSELVEVVKCKYIVDYATGANLGVEMKVKGLCKERVIRENSWFLRNPVTAVCIE